MSHWNYRVILTDTPQGVSVVAIHEVYYNEEGEPDSWSVDPIHAQGETLTELRDDLIHQALALTKPTLRIESATDEDGDTVEWLVEVTE